MFKPTKAQTREYTRRYALKHPDKVAANIVRQKERKIALYKSDPSFRDKQKAYSRARYAEKKDEINARRKASAKAKEYDRSYNKTPKHRRRVRDVVLREKYGITIEQYDSLFSSQKGVCAICGGTHKIKDRWDSGTNTLQVDHNHDTGAVRGLLCYHCNVGLGHFRDDIDRMRDAIEYLQRTATMDYRRFNSA